VELRAVVFDGGIGHFSGIEQAGDVVFDGHDEQDA